MLAIIRNIKNEYILYIRYFFFSYQENELNIFLTKKKKKYLSVLHNIFNKIKINPR